MPYNIQSNKMHFKNAIMKHAYKTGEMYEYQKLKKKFYKKKNQ